MNRNRFQARMLYRVSRSGFIVSITLALLLSFILLRYSHPLPAGTYIQEQEVQAINQDIERTGIGRYLAQLWVVDEPIVEEEVDDTPDEEDSVTIEAVSLYDERASELDQISLPILEESAIEFTSCDLDVMLVIDASHSMDELPVAKSAAEAFVNQLRDIPESSNVRVGIVVFGYSNTRTYVLSPLRELSIPSQYNAVINAIHSIEINSQGTCISCGLYEANRELVGSSYTSPATGQRQYVVLFSDGKGNRTPSGNQLDRISGESDGEYKIRNWTYMLSDQVYPLQNRGSTSEANRGRNAGIEYHVIGYPGGANDSMFGTSLRQVANDPDSNHFVATSSSDEWMDAFVSLAGNLCSEPLPTRTPIPTRTPTPMLLPTPTVISEYGILSARASLVDQGDTCTVFSGLSPTPILLVDSNFSLSNQYVTLENASRIQVDENPVQWESVPASTAPWRLHTNSSGNYVLETICCSATGLGSCDPNSLYGIIRSEGDTIHWNVGYASPGPWVQTAGGDVIVGDSIESGIPVSSGSYFNGSNGVESGTGLVVYRNEYDFSASFLDRGETLVSDTGWLLQNPDQEYSENSRSWYEFFASQHDNDHSPTITPISGVIDLPEQNGEYIVAHTSQSDFSNAETWTIDDGDSYVLFVRGNVSINYPIQLSGNGTGFFALFSTGDISVSSSVGVPYTSSTPVIEGIFVADGEFYTGESQVSGRERLVAKGSFIASKFNLQRNLRTELMDMNTTTSSELFIFNPSFMFTMPTSLKNVEVRWGEVVP